MISPRQELREITAALRRSLAAERADGLVVLTGLPPARQPPVSPPSAPEAPAASAVSTPPPPVPEPRAVPEPPTAPAEVAAPAAPVFQPQVRALDQPSDALAPFGDLVGRVAACRSCTLCDGRTATVFGEGSPHADLVFCGEAPGYEEDRSGRPFVGAAGVLLTSMIENGLRMRREDVFILNTLKCRPPRNRAPSPVEAAACRPFLEEQLSVLRPRVIVALGNSAVRSLLGEAGGITRLRGTVVDALGAKVVPTFHPAYLLRNPAAKRDAWEDLKLVMRLLAEPR